MEGLTKFSDVMIGCAKLWADQSYCVKKKVGAVLADEGRIVATGYNGTVKGKDNVCEIPEFVETEEDIRLAPFYCPVKKKHYKLKTSPFTMHAEQNVIAFCAKQGISTDGLTMYITLSPCATCAKLMVQAGITKVIYLEEYKDTSGIEFLKECNVEVIKYV